jgi:D-alanyl-D-alanine carboxypeptidase
VPGGFFSANPDSDDKRSIRTNNPGALNISPWQRSRPGFVGVTADDGKGNVTSIYCAPEYGVASWYHLLAVIYEFARTGSFSIQQLARKYAGPNAAQSKVDNYVTVWCRVADPRLTGDSVIQLGNDSEMLNLARAMYRNEAGKPTPLSDAQILFAIQHERNNSLPPPPPPPAAQVAARVAGGSSSS